MFGGGDLSAQADPEWIRLIFSVVPGTFASAASTAGFLPGGSFLRSYSHLSVVADVRLHNRNDLCKLPGFPVNTAVTDDRELLLAAYEKWGDECGTHLLGEFAFAIWDDRRKRLFCCRDHLGFRPLFYWTGGTRFLIASTRAAILAIPGVTCKLNRRKFAGTVIHAGHTNYPFETFHQDIMCLPAASSLTLVPGEARSRQYWMPTPQSGLVPRKPDDILEGLRDLLREAVDCRIATGSRVAAELSGGLDSSAITAIASRVLAGRGENMLGLACVVEDSRPAGLADERSFIDEFQTWNNIHIRYVTASGGGPFDRIEEPEFYRESPVRTSRGYLYEALERVAVDAGVQQILQGIGGEMGPTAHGSRYITELALRMRWIAMVRTARELGRIERRNPLRLLAGEMRQYLMAHGRKQAPPAVLLTREFSGFGEPAAAFRSSSPFHRDYQTAMVRRYLSYTGDTTGQTIGGKVRTGSPLLDKRLLEFCLSAPPELKVRDGYRRYLIRGALGGILPERIRWRTDKVPFSPDYYIRYNAQLAKAVDFVGAIRPGDPVRSVIDIPRLAGLLKPVAAGVRSPVARDTVPRTLYAICFLRQFAEFRP